MEFLTRPGESGKTKGQEKSYSIGNTWAVLVLTGSSKCLKLIFLSKVVIIGSWETLTSVDFHLLFL